MGSKWRTSLRQGDLLLKCLQPRSIYSKHGDVSIFKILLEARNSIFPGSLAQWRQNDWFQLRKIANGPWVGWWQVKGCPLLPSSWMRQLSGWWPEHSLAIELLLLGKHERMGLPFGFHDCGSGNLIRFSLAYFKRGGNIHLQDKSWLPKEL